MQDYDRRAQLALALVAEEVYAQAAIVAFDVVEAEARGIPATAEQVAVLERPEVRDRLLKMTQRVVSSPGFQGFSEQQKRKVREDPETVPWHQQPRARRVELAQWAGLPLHRIPPMRPARCAMPRQRRAAPVHTSGSRRAGASSSSSSSDPGGDDGESDPPPRGPLPSPVGSRPWRRADGDLAHVCQALRAAGLPASCSSCDRGSA